MNVAYKVIKPFGCAKIGDIFNFDSDDKEFVMEDTKTTKKGTNSRFMSINEEYVDALVKGGNLDKVRKDFEEGKIQPCLKLESETVNQNLLKLINAIQQILDVDKKDNE